MIEILTTSERNDIYYFSYREKNHIPYYPKRLSCLGVDYYNVQMYHMYLGFDFYKKFILNQFTDKFFDCNVNEIFFIVNELDRIYGHIIFINGKYFSSGCKINIKNTIKIFKFLSQIERYND